MSVTVRKLEVLTVFVVASFFANAESSSLFTVDTAVDVSTVAECDGKPCVAIKMDKNALSGTELDIGDVMFSKKNEIALDSSTDELTYEGGSNSEAVLTRGVDSVEGTITITIPGSMAKLTIRKYSGGYVLIGEAEKL